MTPSPNDVNAEQECPCGYDNKVCHEVCGDSGLTLCKHPNSGPVLPSAAEEQPCPHCNGEGWVFKSKGEEDKKYGLLRFEDHHVTCPTCHGTGIAPGKLTPNPVNIHAKKDTKSASAGEAKRLKLSRHKRQCLKCGETKRLVEVSGYRPMYCKQCWRTLPVEDGEPKNAPEDANRQAKHSSIAVDNSDFTTEPGICGLFPVRNFSWVRNICVFPQGG